MGMSFWMDWMSLGNIKRGGKGMPCGLFAVPSCADDGRRVWFARSDAGGTAG